MPEEHARNTTSASSCNPTAISMVTNNGIDNCNKMLSQHIE